MSELGGQRRIAYLAHDLNDAAVGRRVEMIRRGGGEVRTAGFTRYAAPSMIGGKPAVTFGTTRDMRLAHRARTVLGTVLRRKQVRRFVADADVILARNLEMLLLAHAARLPGQRVVYECLDIHRMMLGKSAVSFILRAIERLLIARSELVLTSSPAFVERYFSLVQAIERPICLIENRVLGDGSDAPALPRPPAPSPGQPWRIGWFGIIRCRRSLAALAQLTLALPNEVEVTIAGRPNLTEIPDFEAQVAAAPGIRFVGPYHLHDLPRLYAGCHFAWSIDFFEAGLNSNWLLPNRLYESLANGAVPLALSEVEVGRWLSRHGVGICLDDVNAAADRLGAMTADEYAGQSARIASLPSSLLRVDGHGCRELVDHLAGSGSRA